MIHEYTSVIKQKTVSYTEGGDFMIPVGGDEILSRFAAIPTVM